MMHNKMWIHAVLANAEETKSKDEVLSGLKGLAFDAESVLDDYYKAKAQEVFDSTLSPFEDTMAFQINYITKRVHKIAVQCETLNLRVRNGEWTLDSEPNLQCETLGELVVYGRREDRERVVELLLLDRRNRLSIIPIVGTGGVGKTTLAQLAYNDPIVCEHFDVRGWVCVSEDFNLVRLSNAILASMSGHISAWSEITQLQAFIKQELGGKKFLLVLDDVHNENKSLWESLRDSLMAGLEGSVVLATTRNESVAMIMQTVPFYRLECLSEENCWLLFERCVFGSTRNPSAYQNLVSMGKGIVEKFRGLPLAAKMVGCLLSSDSDEESWHNIVHSNLWDSDEAVNVISPAIVLSYDNLPAHLQRCFVYCALFPKDYLFKKDLLVRLWIAEGFVQPLEGKQHEDLGVEYFDELLRRSFFQYSQMNQERFVVHDLIHDLIVSISKKEICRIEDGNLCSVTSETLHSSLVPRDFGAPICIHSNGESKDLHTFLVINRLLNTCDDPCVSSKDRLQLQIPNDMFTNLECLRTLDLSEANIVELPDSIGNLKCLRYLCLNHTEIESLPETLCSLYNLQTLEMQCCYELRELPRGTKNLINLRHLRLPRYGKFLYMPHGIGFLTNLQTLSPIHVGGHQEHFTITELKGLVNLRGELEISGIGNVACVDHANGVLKHKEYVTKLILRFSSRYDMEVFSIPDYSIFGGEVEDFLLSQLFNDEPNLDHESQSCESSLVDDGTESKAMKEEIVVPKRITKASLRKKNQKIAEESEEGIFDYLRPHTNLTELIVQTYYSLRFPNWMGDPSFTKLVSVTLDSCSNCKFLPPLGQLPSLKHLFIEGLSEVKSINHEFYGQDDRVSVSGFPSLETLHFRSMYKWEEWHESESDAFPRLNELTLNYCPMLSRIPHLLFSLKKLAMCLCSKLTVLPTLPRITELEIYDCNENIWSSVSKEFLARLQSLKISRIQDLGSLPLYNLFTLTKLEIVRDYESIGSSFGHQLSKMGSLKSLKIHYCPKIWFAQDQELPLTLQFLDIQQCPLLVDWCREHGSSRLVHIPQVILDQQNFHPVKKDINHIGQEQNEDS